MAIEMNEMKLTAFALGELYGPERAAVEAHVAQDPDARRFVDEMRETARVVADELAHEPVVGLLAVHHAAIERQLEEVDHLRPLRIHRAPAQPLGTRMRHWAAFGLTAAAAVLIVGGALAVLAPQLYDPNGGAQRAAKGPNRGPIYLPGYGTNSANDGSVARSDGAPDPFQRPEPVAVDDASNPAAAPLDPAVAGASPKAGIARNTRPGDDLNPQVPFGAPPTDAAAPRVKRPGDAATADALARGGAERPAEYAPVRAARSDDDRSVPAPHLPILENPFVNVAERPLSTFAVNVDPASYFAVRRTLNAGKQRVAPADVRVEELLNYFSYDYKQPAADSSDAFAASIEVTDCPWDNQHRLVRIGLRGKDVPAAAGDKKPAPGGLVFLVDVSASMGQGNKLGILKGAIRSLAETMTPADRLAIVTYGGAAGGGTLALPATGGKDKQKVLDAIDALVAAGAPAAGDAGVAMAYEQAAGKGFVRGGVNRVVVCTDADFTAGVADQLKLNDLIIGKATKSTVQLGVIAVGAARLNDPAMRGLARRGGGTYVYADTPAEAKQAVAAMAAPAPAVIAKDVKVQVEFNPMIAGAYRLIGYENGPVSADDPSADRQFLAGRSVTALYEVVPQGKAVPGAEVFALKYSKANPGFVAPSINAVPSDELLTLKLHYVPTDDKGGDRPGKLQEFPAKDAKSAKFAKASRDFKFAAAVAEFAMILRGSEYRGKARMDRVIQLATEGAEGDPTGRRREFVDLVRKAEQGPKS